MNRTKEGRERLKPALPSQETFFPQKTRMSEETRRQHQGQVGWGACLATQTEKMLLLLRTVSPPLTPSTSWPSDIVLRGKKQGFQRKTRLSETGPWTGRDSSRPSPMYSELSPLAPLFLLTDPHKCRDVGWLPPAVNPVPTRAWHARSAPQILAE